MNSEDVAEVVSNWTGIPVQKMMEGEKEKLLNMESIFNQRVIGQDKAISATADVIRNSKLGFSDFQKPIGSFLFMGKTGVGKTELAKTIADALFDNEKALVRIDMSELMEQHSVSKLIGSPPGYVGFENGGYLTERVRRRPYSVILFDEIEKAHPQVLNILLQVLDEGHLTDSKGRTVNFKNTIIVMTSNLSVNELETFLRPEFRNRIDETIRFNDLSEDVISKIVELNIQKMVNLFESNGYKCLVDQKVMEDLCKRAYHPDYGARPIKRLIKNEIVSQVSKYILKNQNTKVIKILYDNGIKVAGHKPNSLKIAG